jgi:hypothetical protein
MPQAQQTRFLPTQQRAATIAPATFNAEARSVEVVWTTGARGRRFDFWSGQVYEEELEVSSSAVDLSRLNGGQAPVLNSHDAYDLSCVIGVVDRAWIENGEGRATVRLSDREDIAGLVRDIETGIVKNISVGYNVRKYEITSAANRTDGGTVPLYRGVDWMPAEISFVPIPFDAATGTRAATDQSRGSECEFSQPTHLNPPTVGTSAATPPEGNRTMTAPVIEAGGAPATTQTPAPAAAPVIAPDTRAADIADLCTRHGVPQLAAGMIRNGTTAEQAGLAVLAELARRDAASGGHRNVGGRIETVQDEMQVRMAGIEQAILHRIAAKTVLDDNGRQYRGLSLIEMGRDFLEAHGQQTRGLDRMTLASRMLTFRAGGMMGTSDFSTLFANVANKRLRSAYDENAGTYAMWARRAPNAPDFKNMSVVQLAGAPDLLQTNEAGEFKYGAMTDGGETYAMLTYGRIVSLTRQAIVNDDLRAFERMVSAFGFAARRLENRTVYSQLTANANLADGGALFNATAVTTAGGHANLLTSSALAIATLTAGRTAMRRQTGLQSEELNLAPAYLIVPATLEQTAYNLTSANYVPATKAEINEFRAGGRTAVTPIVEPVLDGNSTSAWYLAAENAQVDTVEYCYLDGAEGPVIESEIGFETDGVSYKCRLDFAAKAVDYRGLIKATA